MLKEVLNAVVGVAKAGLDSLRGESGVVPSAESIIENPNAPSAGPQGTLVPIEPVQVQGEVQLPGQLEAPSLEPELHDTEDTEDHNNPRVCENGAFKHPLHPHQYGIYNFTTRRNTWGIFLDPNNRWIKLRDKLFVDTPEMRALEEKYYQRVTEVAAKTVEQKYAEKVSYLEESEETKEFSGQLSFDALTQAHQKYSTIPAENGTTRKSAAGRNAVPFQLALGSEIVQCLEDVSDREAGKVMSENPFIQYFCGFDSFSLANHVPKSKISELKEVFDLQFMKEINETFLKMKIENIHLEQRQEAQKEVDKAEDNLKKALKSAEQAQKNALKAKEAETELKERFDGMASKEEIKAAEEKTKAAEAKEKTIAGKVKKAEDGVQKAKEKLSEAVAKKDDSSPAKGQQGVGQPNNAGSLSIDATANPGNGKYPQDFDLLNDARKKADQILSCICAKTGTAKPRTNKIVLQKEVKDLSKKKKRTDEDIRPVVKHLLGAIEHIFKSLDEICKNTGYEFTPDETYNLMVIKTVYGQQKYMFENHVQRVPHRIVSFSMPHLRPIVRGKVSHNYEFGPKTEISIDENGFVRLEQFSFEAFNEGTRLQEAIERFKDSKGHYPEVVRCDQIYRTKANRAYCKERGIRISGPRLGRKPKDEEKLKEQIELEQADMVDRIEIERQFSREKHNWGLGRIMERTPGRMGHAVGMGVFLNNLIPVGFSWD